jgi:uncharacterized protein (TIGR03086 family)
MSQTAELQRAFDSTGAVLGAVDPSQLDDATPCASWKVRDLINHTIGAAEGFANIASDTPLNTGAETDYASGDFKAAYAEQSARVMAAFSADGAMEKMMEMPFGTMPGAAVAGMVMTDAFTHGWDLARSTGQSTDLDPELAAAILERSKQFIQPSFRGPDGTRPFGPEVAVPDTAPAADRLAGFLGRPV